MWETGINALLVGVQSGIFLLQENLTVFNNLAISLLIYPENTMPTIHIFSLSPQISPFLFPIQQSYNTSKISLPTTKKKLLLFANKKKHSRASRSQKQIERCIQRRLILPTCLSSQSPHVLNGTSFIFS